MKIQKKSSKKTSESKSKEKKVEIFRPIMAKHYLGDVILVYGFSGSGKTIYALSHPNAAKGYYLDLENRYKEKLENYPKFRESTKNLVIVPQYKEYMLDPVATFKKINSLVFKIVNEKKPKLIVLDGIEDLRAQAIEHWQFENKKEPAMNWRSWRVINDMVKHVVHKLINYCRIEGAKLILTTMIGHEVIDGTRTGKTYIDAKDYITRHVSTIYKMKRDGMRFLIKRGKSPKGPTDWVDITCEEMIEGEIEDE